MSKLFIRSYLFLYNFCLSLGWVYVLYLAVSSRNDYKMMWRIVEFPLKIFQTAAIIEIVHAALGFVKSSALLTFFQVLSRITTVWGALHTSPPSQVSMGVPLILCAWTLSEIIRYSYHCLNSFGMASITQWLRYTLFIVLYPIGVLGEIICLYFALDFVDKENIWGVEMPNTFNVSFRFRNFLLLALFSYSVCLPSLYIHLLAQRKRIVGNGSTKTKIK